MNRLKKNFLWFSILGLIVVIVVSSFSILEHRKILKQQQQISTLYKAINVSLSNIHKISDLVASLEGLSQREQISGTVIAKLNSYIITAKTNENLLIKWIDKNKKDHDMAEIIQVFEQKEFTQRVDRFIDKTVDLIDFSVDTHAERIKNIQSISKMNQNSLDVLFSKVIDKVSFVQKSFIKKTERIGFFLVVICLLEILFVWFFVFTPLYKMVNNQHEELKKLKENLEEANIAKNDFIANISHEIRTPMTAILGYIDLLKKEEISEQKKQNAYEIISRNADHLLDLIDEVLDISKMENGRLEVESRKTDLAELLNEVFALMLVKAQSKSLDFKISYKTPVYKYINTDPKRFKQILLNLLGNAIKFTKKGSVDLILNISDVDNLELRVLDTGCGIEESKRSNLFKPFSQADSSISRKYGGTGLGLVISEHLANKLGARLVIEKTILDKGTSMLLTFSKECFVDKVNRVDKFSIQAIKPSEKRFAKYEKEYKLGRVKILVVDDAKENVFLFKAYLENVNAEVEAAYGGKEALEKIKNNIFDLVLLDLQMPDMSGYEVIQEAKIIKPHLKIYALTAHAMESEKIKTKNAGFDGHITKPISAKDLVNTIYNYLY